MAAHGSLSFLVGLFVLFHLSAAFVPAALPVPALYEDQFKEWQVRYGKEYRSEEERQTRLKVFMENVIYIDQHNKEGHSYQLKANEFADTTFEEFKEQYLMDPQNCSAATSGRSSQIKYSDPPKAIDWRQMGAITPVGNQGSCGSCWAFSASSCLAAHHFLKTKQLTPLSEQQLVDCSQGFGNHGCNGGLPSQAFEYVMYNKGQESNASYPFTARVGRCHFMASDVAATVARVVNITANDEMAMYNAVGTVGPVSFAYDVVKSFRFYKSGVFSSDECSQVASEINHAVLAVGYNTTADGQEYWIAKNSWGTQWGMDGYFWIVRGKNMCGLADCPSFPVV